MSYKLTYFGFKGRGELPRLLFAAGGVKYEDKRISMEDWPKIKPTTPQGTMPILEVENEVISQSLAIVRFLARKFKLMGTTDLEEAKVNEIVDTLTDLRTALYGPMFEKDEAKKAEMTKKLQETTIPTCLAYLEKTIEKNKSGFLVGKSVTVADIAMFDVTELTLTSDPKLLDSYKGLKALREKVSQLPRIEKWLKERPKTDY